MQSEKLITRSLRQNFHASIVIVADPSSDPKRVCLALDEPAETDALHASADEETAGLNRSFGVSHFF
jgi:hypothetical protein